MENVFVMNVMGAHPHEIFVWVGLAGSNHASIIRAVLEDNYIYTYCRYNLKSQCEEIFLYSTEMFSRKDAYNRVQKHRKTTKHINRSKV